MKDHGVGLSALPEASKRIREMAGPSHRIDLTLRGGERIAFEDNRSVRVLHVPGHSNGHVAFYYAKHRSVFVGDALHGGYCPSVKGDPSLPPAYFSILAYLSSVQLIESLEVEWIYSAHWPPYPMEKAAEFLGECRRFVQMADGQVRKSLERHPDGLTLRTCMDECGPVLGKWPVANQWLLMYPLHGHLAHLEETGEAERFHDGGHVKWRAI